MWHCVDVTMPNPQYNGTIVDVFYSKWSSQSISHQNQRRVLQNWSTIVYLFIFRSRDEDFYSNIAANAEDGLSDVSEADVKEMAQSIKVCYFCIF